MMRSLRDILIILTSVSVLSMMLSSCCEPSVSDRFIKKSKAKDGSRYDFELVLSDSTSLYDLTLYTRLNCTPRQFAAMEDGFGVGAVWTSPDSLEYREVFYIPKAAFVRDSFYSRSASMPYRRALKPAKTGIWTLSLIMLEGTPEFMDGLGLNCRKYQENF